MARMNQSVTYALALALLVPLAGCASIRSRNYIYYPRLASRVLAGDFEAFREALELASITEPGERMEELAELSGRFVRIDPVGFLRGQQGETDCFGVAFLGPDYVDNERRASAEIRLRRIALESVKDKALQSIRDTCLRQLE